MIFVGLLNILIGGHHNIYLLYLLNVMIKGNKSIVDQNDFKIITVSEFNGSFSLELLQIFSKIFTTVSHVFQTNTVFVFQNILTKNYYF